MTLRTAFSTILIIGLAFTGCAAKPTEDTTNANEPSHVVISTAPSLAGIPATLAVDQGFFEEEGLEVEVVPATSPAEQAPLLLKGDIQFMYSGVHDTLLAAGQDMPFKLVVPMTMTGSIDDAEPGFGNLIVAADSDIQEPADLEGRTVSVTSIGGTSYMDFVTKLQQLDVDPDEVNWVEVPVQSSLDRLSQGQVDAATSSEPFGTMAVEAGDARFLMSADDVIPDVGFLGLVTSDDYASQHPETVQAVANAILRANQYALDHPETVEKMAAETFDISPELAAQVSYPTYATRLFSAEDVVPQLERIQRFDPDASLPEAESILLDDSVFEGNNS